MIQELTEYQQLTKDDVEQALQHADLQATPIYSSFQNKRKKQKPATIAQLYFGPGFENRVEMEMEELLRQQEREEQLSKGGVDESRPEEEEEAWRAKEDQLFGSLATRNPKLESELVSLSTDNTTATSNTNSETDPKKRVVFDQKDTTAKKPKT